MRLVAVVAALLLSGCASSGPAPLEDEPGWNCATMGNRVCGEVLK
jgi:hypothetical protein